MREWEIPLYKVFMSQDASEELKETFCSGWIGEGPKVSLFEKTLEDYFDISNVVAVNSCTSALELSLHMINDGSGGEIITNPISCFASVSAILSQGFTPRFVDIDAKTGNLDLDYVAQSINEKTKGILAVHFCGIPSDCRTLYEIADKNDLWVIEDCAQAMGSVMDGKRIGSDFGRKKSIRCFSFQSTKTLTTGDGGALIVPDSLYKRAKKLRWYGIDRNGQDRYLQNIQESGYKFIMNDIDATIGISNFNHFERLNEIQRVNWEFYHKELSEVEGIKLSMRRDDSYSSCSLFPVLVGDRDKFEKRLESQGIQAIRPHGFCANHDCVKEFHQVLPSANWFYKKLTAIPSGWWVTPEDSKKIVKVVKESLK